MTRKRIYQNIFATKIKAEKGGGKKYVEEKINISINEMYIRMIAHNELNKENKHNHGTEEQAQKLIEYAQPVAKYLPDGKIKEYEDQALKIMEKITEEEENKFLDAKIAERQNQQNQIKEQE